RRNSSAEPFRNETIAKTVIANAKKPLEDEINKKQIMVNTIVNNKTKPNFTENIGKVLFVLSGIFLFIAALNVFQDFLESRRSGFDFNFNESILFKTVWFVFIPILVILYQKLKNERLDSY